MSVGQFPEGSAAAAGSGVTTSSVGAGVTSKALGSDGTRAPSCRAKAKPVRSNLNPPSTETPSGRASPSNDVSQIVAVENPSSTPYNRLPLSLLQAKSPTAATTRLRSWEPSAWTIWIPWPRDAPTAVTPAVARYASQRPSGDHAGRSARPRVRFTTTALDPS